MQLKAKIEGGATDVQMTLASLACNLMVEPIQVRVTLDMYDVRGLASPFWLPWVHACWDRYRGSSGVRSCAMVNRTINSHLLNMSSVGRV